MRSKELRWDLKVINVCLKKKRRKKKKFFFLSLFRNIKKKTNNQKQHPYTPVSFYFVACDMFVRKQWRVWIPHKEPPATFSTHTPRLFFRPVTWHFFPRKTKWGIFWWNLRGTEKKTKIFGRPPQTDQRRHGEGGRNGKNNKFGQVFWVAGWWVLLPFSFFLFLKKRR